MRVRRPDLPAEPVTWRRSTAVSDNHQPHPLLLHEIKRPATTRWWWHTTAIRARRGRREREEWRRKKETKREREIGATDRRSEPRTSGLRHYPTGLPVSCFDRICSLHSDEDDDILLMFSDSNLGVLAS
ncbi:hypothetical protein HanRHA438_Chr10g0450741 [Helianthus annuus]|nr:hypothetical protein HanRHA438_Chr10g0450741 [Helianthus annuus]